VRQVDQRSGGLAHLLNAEQVDGAKQVVVLGERRFEGGVVDAP
jgi:hypothetical protein